MSLWKLSIICYSSLALITAIPLISAILKKAKLFEGGASFDDSSFFTKEAKQRLVQNHSRIIGSLHFWKKQAKIYMRFHYYALGWVIPSSVLIPFLSQAINDDIYSKWLLSVVSAFSAILLSFHKWLKVEQNYKAFRQGESNYYDLQRRLLDRPKSFGEFEELQLNQYFHEVEIIRQRVRDAEIDNFPGSEIPKYIGNGIREISKVKTQEFP